jgi:hypothetical protein
MRAVTVNNIYLNFGKRKGMGDIFVGMLNRESLLQAYTPTFPKRLDQGESFDYLSGNPNRYCQSGEMVPSVG